MSALELIGFGYVVLATGCFSAAWLIAVTYVIQVGVKTVWRYIQIGQQSELPPMEWKARRP